MNVNVKWLNLKSCGYRKCIRKGCARWILHLLKKSKINEKYLSNIFGPFSSKSLITDLILSVKRWVTTSLPVVRLQKKRSLLRLENEFSPTMELSVKQISTLKTSRNFVIYMRLDEVYVEKPVFHSKSLDNSLTFVLKIRNQFDNIPNIIKFFPNFSDISLWFFITWLIYWCKTTKSWNWQNTYI